MDLKKTEEIFFNFDSRTSKEKDFQNKKIEELSSKNQKIFIENKNPTDKINKYLPHIIKKTLFKNNWYVKYTDNIDSHSFFEITIPIITFHGCPGYYHDWLGLEKEIGANKIRIINFFVPGFDSEPENNRGDYSSSLDDFCDLVNMLLDSLKINKAIFMIHSMGGYLIYYYCQKFSERVAGLIFVAAPSINWYIGYIAFYGTICARSKFNRYIGEANYFLNIPKFRKYFTKKINEETSLINFDYNTNFPILTENEICSFVKIMTSIRNCSTLYSYGRNLPRVLKFLSCGKNDPINEYDKFVECFYFNVYGEGKIHEKKDLPYNFKEELKNIFKKDKIFEGINFNFDNIQENFVFSFDKTGHNVHKKRCKELAKPILIYSKIIELIEKLNKIPISKI